MRTSVTRVVKRTYRNADGSTYTESVRVNMRADATLRSTSGGKPMKRNTMSHGVMTQFRPGASASYDWRPGQARSERWEPRRETPEVQPRKRTAVVTVVDNARPSAMPLGMTTWEK